MGKESEVSIRRRVETTTSFTDPVEYLSSRSVSKSEVSEETEGSRSGDAVDGNSRRGAPSDREEKEERVRSGSVPNLEDFCDGLT